MQNQKSAINRESEESAPSALGMTTDDTITVGDLRNAMARFVAQRDWEKFHTAKNLAASVSIEAAELLELFQWLTEKESDSKSKSDLEFREKIEDELSDVLLYLLSLANNLQLDVATAVFNKLEKNRKKYPQTHQIASLK